MSKTIYLILQKLKFCWDRSDSSKPFISLDLIFLDGSDQLNHSNSPENYLNALVEDINFLFEFRTSDPHKLEWMTRFDVILGCQEVLGQS